MKPLGIKNYGSIGHLPGSRLGPGDHHVHDGQGLICTEKARDRHDRIIVQEKLDGSNVGIGKIGGAIVPVTRAGWRAESSPFEQHHFFAAWVARHWSRWNDLLEEGERLCGEWLAQAFELPLVTSVGYETPGSFGSWCADLNLHCITAEFPPISSDEASEKYLFAMANLLRWHPKDAIRPS